MVVILQGTRPVGAPGNHITKSLATSDKGITYLVIRPLIWEGDGLMGIASFRLYVGALYLTEATIFDRMQIEGTTILYFEYEGERSKIVLPKRESECAPYVSSYKGIETLALII